MIEDVVILRDVDKIYVTRKGTAQALQIPAKMLVRKMLACKVSAEALSLVFRKVSLR
jgi:hypothetical protein